MRIGRRLFSTKGTAVDQIPAAHSVAASLPLVGGRQTTTPRARFSTIRCDIQETATAYMRRVAHDDKILLVFIHRTSLGFSETRTGTWAHDLDRRGRAQGRRRDPASSIRLHTGFGASVAEHRGPVLVDGDCNGTLHPRIDRSYVTPAIRHDSPALRRLLTRAQMSDVPEDEIERAVDSSCHANWVRDVHQSVPGPTSDHNNVTICLGHPTVPSKLDDRVVCTPYQRVLRQTYSESFGLHWIWRGTRSKGHTSRILRRSLQLASLQTGGTAGRRGFKPCFSLQPKQRDSV
uniref:Uncharacterized protein n=1 Tax=Hyaloperonospora arabidopsidis (strain Emoy2) TaxID=559515 RepID=M4BZW0_HYAAE